MKKILLPLAVLVSTSIVVLAQDSGDIPGTPLGYQADQDEMFGYSRFWSYYNPYPSNYIGSRDWWGGNSLTGDWWGVRNYLDDSGFEISATYTNNIAGNPVGGMSQGFTYTDNTSFGVQLDFEKLIGWHGATLTISVQCSDQLATRGARLRVDPTPEWFAMAGIYQATQIDLYEGHGLNWSMNNSDGVTMVGQVGWTPEFFKKPVAASAAKSDGKSAVSRKSLSEGKTFKEPVDSEMRGLPGHYWFGMYFSPWDYAQFGSNETAINSYGFYWHADQMIWQETPGSDQGLTLWSAFVLSPQQNISKLPFQANAGIVYRGLLPTRDQDITMLGMAYGNFSDDYADTVSQTGAGSPSYELALEAGYRFQITKFAYVQPNLQWIINPGGTGNIPNALVLGAQMSVSF